jgi:hypothetical protein
MHKKSAITLPFSRKIKKRDSYLQEDWAMDHQLIVVLEEFVLRNHEQKESFTTMIEDFICQQRISVLRNQLTTYKL